MNKYLFPILIILLSLAGCESNSLLDPSNSANIIGSVNLYDEGTTLLPKDGMTVSVDGANSVISSKTNEAGAFTLNNVPFGTYNITFSKTGYGTFKKIGVVHANNGSSTVISPSPSLGQKSTTIINGLNVSTSNNIVTLSIRTVPQPTNTAPRYIRVFYSRSSNVSYINYLKYSGIYSHKSNPANLDLTATDFNEMGFVSGERIYVRVYGDSFWSNDYENTVAGIHEFPNINITTVAAVSFVVP